MDDDGRIDPADEADVLIGRLIDGEASTTDRLRFDDLAAGRPSLWRRLALRQEESVILTAAVAEATHAAARRELPRRWLVPNGVSWTLALSGWAAVIIVAVSWGVVALSNGDVNPTVIEARDISPEEHYRHYMSAPYVLGDMQPQVLEVEELSDGRVAVHFVRRIEEVAFLDPNRELPVDDSGELTSDPTRLRDSEPRVGMAD